MANRFQFDIVLRNLDRVKKELPLQVANTTKNFFIKENYNKQQFDGKKWKDVNRRGGKSRRSNSAILVQTGRMRRAVANSLKKATFDLIEFNVTEATAKGGFNYASVHQFGYSGMVKGYNRRTINARTVLLVEADVFINKHYRLICRKVYTVHLATKVD